MIDICLKADDQETLAAALAPHGIVMDGAAGVAHGPGWLLDYGFRTIETEGVMGDDMVPISLPVLNTGFLANLRLTGDGAAAIRDALAAVTVAPSVQQRRFA